jgi:vacuolar-type H+-ATPase subunit E/Vma4
MLGAKNTHTRNLWGKEFSVIKEGLAEAEVVAFVSELLKRQEHHQSLMELAQRTVIEAEQLALSLKEKAKGEAEAEAASILSQAQAQAEQLVQETSGSIMSRAEEEAKSVTQRIYDRFVEAVQEEVGKGIGPAPQPEPGNPLTQKIEETLANWQATPVNSDAAQSPKGNLPAVPDLAPQVTQAKREELVDGRVDLIVAPPIDLAQLTSFQRRLRQQSQIRLLQTVGSWNQGLAITVLVKQALPLIETLQWMPEVETVQGNNGTERDAGKGLRKKVSVTLRHRARRGTED